MERQSVFGVELLQQSRDGPALERAPAADRSRPTCRKPAGHGRDRPAPSRRCPTPAGPDGMAGLDPDSQGAASADN